MFRTLAIILLPFSPLLPARGADDVQSWSSSDGKIIEAKFIRVEGDSVVVDKDGKPFTIPFARLAPASVALATKLNANTAGEAEKTEPTLHFRWLQTDPITADAIVDLIKANNLSTDAFNAKIYPQIKAGKVNEVAAFDKKIDSGLRFLLKPADNNLPLVMEAEAMVSDDGLLMDLRCVPEWHPKTPLGSGLLRSNTATTLSRQHWSLFARWGEAKTDTLLLACGGSKPTQPAPPQAAWAVNGAPVMVHLDAEWRETSAADFAKVAAAPAEDRAKALAWLRGRSKLLGSSSSTCRSGQGSRHEHLWCGKSDAELEEELKKHRNQGPKEPAPRPGITFEWEPAIMASDKPFPALSPTAPIEENISKANKYIHSQELSLRLHATYLPPDSQSKSQQVEYEFRGQLQAGAPEFVAPKAGPQQGQPLAVLVLTPWYEIIRRDSTSHEPGLGK